MSGVLEVLAGVLVMGECALLGLAKRERMRSVVQKHHRRAGPENHSPVMAYPLGREVLMHDINPPVTESFMSRHKLPCEGVVYVLG